MSISPCRIVLFSFTLRRDFPCLHVLKRLLETLGDAKVVIASQRNISHYLRYWRPHALLFQTSQRVRHFERYHPDLKLFYFAGEGGETFYDYDEKHFIKHPHLLDKLERIFLWGEAAKNFMHRDDEELHNGRYKELIDSCKVTVVGHPRTDLSKFMPPTPKKYTIGILTHFYMLNCFDRRTSLNLSFGRPDLLATLENEVKLLKVSPLFLSM